MNYTKYLQTGGELGMPTSKYNLTNKDVDSLIGKILNGDKEAAAIFVDSAVNDPENAWVQEAINGAMMAAEQGDQSAQKFLGIISPMLAENGINLQKPAQYEKAGGNIPSGKAKGGKYGCPCMLKKVGGKIVEVQDCAGIKFAKNGGFLSSLTKGVIGGLNSTHKGNLGMIVKNQSPAGPITFRDLGIQSSTVNYANKDAMQQAGAFLDTQGRDNYYIVRNGKIYKTRPDIHGTISTSNYFTEVDPTTLDRRIYEGLGYVTIGKDPENYKYLKKTDTDGVYSIFGDSTMYGLGSDGRYYSNLGATDAKWDDNKKIWTREGFEYVVIPGSGPGSSSQISWREKAPENTTEDTEETTSTKHRNRNAYGQIYNAATKQYEGQTDGQRNAAAVGMKNADGTGWTVDQRKAWINGAGKDYLASLGINLGNYTGTAAQNRQLFNAYKGFSNWDKGKAEAQKYQQEQSATRRVDAQGNLKQGWQGISDQDLMNWDHTKGSIFDLSSDELARMRDLQRGAATPIKNGEIRNGDEIYTNGTWRDLTDLQGSTGKTLSWQTKAPYQTIEVPSYQETMSLRLPQRNKNGGIISYAQYLRK